MLGSASYKYAYIKAVIHLCLYWYYAIYEKISTTTVLQISPSAWNVNSQLLRKKFLFSRNSKTHHHTQNVNTLPIRNQFNFAFNFKKYFYKSR
jgi:hypothetical protein